MCAGQGEWDCDERVVDAELNMEDLVVVLVYLIRLYEHTK